MKKFSTFELAELGCVLAFAMIASYIEAILPVFPGISGMKLGLANAAIVFCLYKYGSASAIMVNISRIVLCALLFRNMYSLLYAITGAFFSFIVMYLCKKTNIFSIIGVSIAGGVIHNFGQLLIAYLITEIPVLFYYIPVLLIFGTVTGFINGWIAKLIFVRTNRNKTQKKG